MELRESIAELLGITPQYGDEWTIKCLSPAHDDGNPSCSLYVGDAMERQRGGKTHWRLPGFWVCYSCGAHGRIADQRILQYEPSTNRNLDVAEALLKTEELRIFPETWLDLFDYPGGVHPDWLARFTKETCWEQRLGYDYETDSLTYPLRNLHGGVLGVVRRPIRLPGEKGPKYVYPPGSHVSERLFGHDQAMKAAGMYDKQPLVLTEGATDAIAAMEVGFAAVAQFGSHLSEMQTRYIKCLDPLCVILGHDQDEAGEQAAQQAMDMFDDLDVPFYEVRRDWGTEHKDLASMPIDLRRKVLQDHLG